MWVVILCSNFDNISLKVNPIQFIRTYDWKYKLLEYILLVLHIVVQVHGLLEQNPLTDYMEETIGMTKALYSRIY